MGYKISISAVLCEGCGWIMHVYVNGDFYCPNQACDLLWVPYTLHLEMHRKELERRAS